jgi:predicted O-methyltransferase YrrM
VTRQPGLPAYDAAAHFPPLVWKAVELTRSHDFPPACIPETGRLLQLCASLRGVGRACELGTAYGVGAAWMASGLVVLDDYTPDSPLKMTTCVRRRAAAGRARRRGSRSGPAPD